MLPAYRPTGNPRILNIVGANSENKYTNYSETTKSIMPLHQPIIPYRTDGEVNPDGFYNR